MLYKIRRSRGYYNAVSNITAKCLAHFLFFAKHNPFAMCCQIVHILAVMFVINPLQMCVCFQSRYNERQHKSQIKHHVTHVNFH